MNKKFLILSLLAGTAAASVAFAGMPAHSGGFAAPRGGTVNRVPVTPRSGNWTGGNWNRGNWTGWHGDWHRHDRDFDNRFFFAGSFGFPFWGWGYPGWGYPGWGYGYGYPYYPGYYGGYAPGYYPGGYPGYYSGGGYGNSDGGSQVAQLQRQLRAAGYYHGSIDGVMGPRTRSALRAYQRDRGMANNNGMGRPVPQYY